MNLNSEINEPIATSFLGQNLTALIKQHHLNLTQLSQLLNIPLMTIRRLMSGETSDPRLSTLKIIADYFNISIDALVNETPISAWSSQAQHKTSLVPKIEWDKLSQIAHTPLTDLTQHWESILSTQTLTSDAFALDSKPSLYPRFPKGTVFVIEPNTSPKDGDIVLIQFKDNNEFTFKELFIDPPQWHLASLVAETAHIDFDSNIHQIVGIVVVTLLYNSRA